jgi:PhoPQ-activated pathogenicity-related protein
MTKIGRICVSVLLAVLIAANCPWARATALDDYVAAPDANYACRLASTINGTGYTMEVWAMTSQAWRRASEVNRTLWEHWLVVIVPNTVSHTKALVWIGGGANGGSPPSSADPMLVQVATVTHSIVAELRMIPNQPLKFADETDPRYVASGRQEDALIAYAWDKYKTTGDATWLPRLPMTKAVVRAMDTIQAKHPAIANFVVGGGSKRGWTTWTTAAVDAASSARVVAIIPCVIDVLNIETSMQHHWDAYGYWAPAIHDYVDMGIPDWFGTPEFRSLSAIVDPYSYVDRLTLPKLIINSTGDQFFLPDSSQFYFNALKGEKYLRYVPNTDHSLNTEAMENLLAYYQAVLTNTARPKFSWTKLPNGSLRVQTETSPTAVRLWQATNRTARNFRLDSIGPAWTSRVLTDQGGGVYVGAAPPPEQGWTAFLVELEYPSGGAYPFKMTTEVSVVPDTLPYRKSPVERWGRY